MQWVRIQVIRLIAAADNGMEIEGLDGPDRAMLYILATWTGFRRRELSSITRASVHLDNGKAIHGLPTPTIRASASNEDAAYMTASYFLLQAWLQELLSFVVLVWRWMAPGPTGHAQMWAKINPCRSKG